MGKPKKVELLFTASQHNFSSAAFHKHCDNIPDTLTLVRTGGGKTIAGYSHYQWNQVSGWLNDSGRRVFLVQMDLGEKLVPKSDNFLIYCHQKCGPSFGRGDLTLFNEGNNKG